MFGIRTDDPVVRARAFNCLLRAYWKPVYKHVRLRWRKDNEEAKDLTQSFFARAFEKRVFETYEPGKAKFRTFIKSCLHNFVANAEQARTRIKRGGAAVTLSLDFDEAESEIAEGELVTEASIEQLFDLEWARHLRSLGLEELRRELGSEGKMLWFELFRRYDLCEEIEERPTYQQLAQELGVKVTDVNNRLASTRRRFRHLVLRKLREITSGEEEFRSEARAVLGLDPDEASRLAPAEGAQPRR